MSGEKENSERTDTTTLFNIVEEAKYKIRSMKQK